MISTVDTAVLSTKDSVTSAALAATAQPTTTVISASAMPTDALMDNVSVSPTTAMMIAQSTLDNAIQNAPVDAMDLSTLTALNVDATQLLKPLHAAVYVTSTTLDQTVASTPAHVSQPATVATDLKPHQKDSLRTSVSVKSVYQTHIVIRTETVSAMRTTRPQQTALSTVAHAIRTANTLLAITIQADVQAQLLMTATTALPTHLDTPMENATVMMTMVTVLLLAATIPEFAITSVTNALDPTIRTVSRALPMPHRLTENVHAMKDMEDLTVPNTT